MHTSYEVIVIRTGSMGMSAGAHLAKRDVKTLLIATGVITGRHGLFVMSTRGARPMYR
jgi:ribulose 1,5-bisphosphate synthetase/thiazole synthase